MLAVVVLASQAALCCLCAPTSTTSESNVFRSAAPLAVDDALGLAPLFPDVEVIPDLPITTFYEIKAVRIGMNSQLDGELTKDAAAVTTHERGQCSLDLKGPSAGAILDRQVEEQVTMDDVGVGFALSAPHARQSTNDSPPKEPFVEPLTNFGEEPAARIIKRDRARPVNRRMGNEGKADRSRMIDRLDEVGRLV